MQRYMLFMMLFLMFSITSVAADDAANDIHVFHSKNGDVTFNHKQHSDGHIKCKTCHDRKGGKIRGLGKEWAHKVCRGCHEAIMSGPLKCNECHILSKK